MTDENPYASPMDVREVEPPSETTADLRSLALRPRWWEVLVFVVLAIRVVLVVWNFFLSVALGELSYLRLIHGFSFVLINVTGLVAFTGGLIVARVWYQGGFPEGPSPGHLLLLAKFAGALINIPFLILLAVAGVFLPGINMPLIMIYSAISLMIPSGIFYALIPRESKWSLVASLFLALSFVVLALTVFETFTTLGPTGGITTPWWLQGMRTLTHLGWILAAGHMLSVAYREHRTEGITSDWLHWTGVACWAISIFAQHGSTFF